MNFDLSSIVELGLSNSLFINNLTSDSKKVTPNSAYFAIKGMKFDGNDFINDAISRGANVIFSEQDSKISNITFIKVKDIRETLAIVASKFYADKPKNMVAVTGTNGKTSVAHFYRQILFLLGNDAASIGTTGMMINDKVILDETLTTPDSITLNKLLTNLKSQKVDYVAQEASSHGLLQNRLLGIDITAAAFTNFSQDHLDYHHSMDNYLNAKILLFSKILKEGSKVVLNSDIQEYETIKKSCLDKFHTIIDYGFKAQSLKIKNISNDISKQIIDFSYQNKDYQIKTDIIGEFQAYNIMCALGLAIATNVNNVDAINILHKLKTVPGRMQRIKSSNIFVDYAHTPDALEQVLKLLKPLTLSRLIVLFGCGGDRDPYKRPLMAKIASKLADLIIVTDDNPRFEEAAKIRKAIISGIDSCEFVEKPDRAQAIKYAINIMDRNDILLIAGKGHEKYQIIGDKTYHLDDAELCFNELL